MSLLSYADPNELGKFEKMSDPRARLAEIVLSMYMDEPCRICGRNILREDLETIVFAGYSDDNTSRAAHKRCWDGMIDVIRKRNPDGLRLLGLS